jgi:hypothetical protein
MATPCDWATKAARTQGATYKLTLEGKSTDALLVHVNTWPAGGGFTNYSFSWIGPIGGPSQDGMYIVQGPNLPETQLFLVAQPDGGQEISYVAALTCQSG